MPALILAELCDGCRGRPEALCRDLCPADILQLNDRGQAVNIEPDQCWECYACVKACPENAIEIRGAADVMPLGARLRPERGEGSIAWTIKRRDGKMQRFQFPIRTTPWGSIAPYAGLTAATVAGLDTPDLCGEERYLGVALVPRTLLVEA